VVRAAGPPEASGPHASARAGDDGDALELRVWEALAAVRDPEIPPLSITDLGIVERVLVGPHAVEVELLPTFAGCPALDVIRAEAADATGAVVEGRKIVVRFVYQPPWTSDRITPAGREALRSHGLTPPGDRPTAFIPVATLRREPELHDGVACPFCGSTDTNLESAFGPTLCRATHFCGACRNPFESFKPKLAH
jgi:ring-1,2-phenylacetyl-CoA epoxidase subunit PaaD